MVGLLLFSSSTTRFLMSSISISSWINRLSLIPEPVFTTRCRSIFTSPVATLNKSSKYAYSCMHRVNRCSPNFFLRASASSNPVRFYVFITPVIATSNGFWEYMAFRSIFCECCRSLILVSIAMIACFRSRRFVYFRFAGFSSSAFPDGTVCYTMYSQLPSLFLLPFVSNFFCARCSYASSSSSRITHFIFCVSDWQCNRTSRRMKMPVELRAPFTAFRMLPLYRVPSILRSSEKKGVIRVTISSNIMGRFSSPMSYNPNASVRRSFEMRPTSVFTKRLEDGNSSPDMVSACWITPDGYVMMIGCICCGFTAV